MWYETVAIKPFKKNRQMTRMTMSKKVVKKG